MGEYQITGTGKVVMDTAPTFVTSITTPSVLATSNGSGSIGAAATAFSNLFLASGAVIGFANSNVVVTHSSGILTVSTGELRVTTAGTNAASVLTQGSTNTVTNKTMTGATNTLTASLLKSATTEVSVAAATAPSSGQVLTATSSTTATWQTPGGGSTVSYQISNSTSYSLTTVAAEKIILIAKGTDGGAAHDVTLSYNGSVVDTARAGTSGGSSTTYALLYAFVPGAATANVDCSGSGTNYTLVVISIK